jgi:malonate decarboxylase beta subunit
MRGPDRRAPASYREATARRRIAALLDPGSFNELLGPAERTTSPHLAALGVPAAFDDGVVVGAGLLFGEPVLAASQEGGFLGGSVGEVHGAKLVGLLRRAARERPSAVLLLLDSGGVRLQEANAGLVAVSEVMRAVLAARAEGVPIVALVGGGWGCFGGTGIVARCCGAIGMSEEGRLGLSGPDVIEATKGVEELDSADRALVWRTYGGKHRYLLGETDLLVDDDVQAFRAAARELARVARSLDLEALSREHALLARRLEVAGACGDAAEVWRAMGIADTDRLPLMDVAVFAAAVASARGMMLAGAPGELPSPTAPAGGEGQGEGGARHRTAALLDELFPAGHGVRARGGLLIGTGHAPAGEVAVVGSTGGAELGVEEALALAAELLRIVRYHPGRPILVLVDSRGQRMSRRDELLGLNGYLGHLASAVELARRRGHRIVALVHGDAVSGGVLPLGFMADEVHAVETANPWVMGLPAMSRVTKIPLERLAALSRTSPVLSPGLEPFLGLGAFEAVWRPPLAAPLTAALSRPPAPDRRAAHGLERGGRLLAAPVAAKVAGGPDRA